jgi:glycerol-3-phosphate dehydrogenase subunit C
MEPIRESLDHCVKCTICETYCPVANVTPLFPGPKYVGPQAERFRTGEISFDDSLDYCSGCGICTQVCPQGVKVAEINSKARSEMKNERGIPMRDKVIARPELTARFATPVAPIANWTLRNKPIRAFIEKTLRVHRDAHSPAGPSGRGQNAMRRPPWKRRSSTSTAAAPSTSSRPSAR